MIEEEKEEPEELEHECQCCKLPLKEPSSPKFGGALCTTCFWILDGYDE
jgi:hypothetical protein